MKGFLPDDKVNNPGAGDPWEDEMRDKGLDDFFIKGMTPEQVGIKYKKSPKAFKNSILNKLLHNYKKEGREHKPGRAERYEPVCRTSRKSMPITKRDLKFINRHRELGVPPEATAKILARPVKQIDDSWKDVPRLKAKKVLAVETDLLLATLYARDVYHVEIVGKQELAELIAQDVEYGGSEKIFKMYDPKHVPEHIRSLALYLAAKYELEKGEK